MSPARTGLREQYGAFNEALSELYHDNLLTLADEDEPTDFDEDLFEEAARELYESGGFDIPQLASPAAQAVVEETMRVLDTAISSALPHEVPETLRHALENNAFIFSGFKTFHSLREVGLSMVTDKGDIKPFSEFLDDVRKINAKYNRNYLYAEYNHALGASQMAAKWHDIEQDGDDYDLQYRTAGDSRVREEHAALHGTTLPPSDPFWERYLPPNGWNCRCTAVQVRRNKFPRSDSQEAIRLGDECTAGPKRSIFRYNPGKTMEVFPGKHPYFKAPAQAKDAAAGYIPETWTPKTIAEAERFFADKLGVRCSLKGFTKTDMAQVEEIYRSVERHFQCYPELKQETKFVGSIKGRIELLTQEKFKELQKSYPFMPDDELMKHAKKWARKLGSSAGCYAYSHGACKDWNLSGIAFNTEYRGDKVKNYLQRDVKSKWHPPGTGTVKAVIDHELGHEIDRLVGLRTHSDFLKLFNEEKAKGKQHIIDNLSQYGDKNAAEFIAEAWSEYLNNEKPRPIAVAVGRLVIQQYKKKNGQSSSTT